MLKAKRLLTAAIFAGIFCTLGAQTNSPYSRYGYGILSDQATGISKGMGGASYGIRNSLSANVANPASYSKVDSLTFLFDMGVYVNSAKLTEGSASRSDYNGGLDYITLLFPVTKKLGVSVGILPMSSVGYDFGTTFEDGGFGSELNYEGSGGLSQLYIGAAYELPIKGLSVGANVSYLFGKLKYDKEISRIWGANSELSRVNSHLKMSSIKLDLGVQYDLPVNKNDIVTFGAVYTPKINSKGRYREFEEALVTVEGGKQPISRDTIFNADVDAGRPHSLGLGAAWYHKKNLTVAADVTYQHWKGVKYGSQMGDQLSSSDRFNNRWRFNGGVEYLVDPHSPNYFKRIRMRGGMNYSNSYMNVKSDQGPKGYNEYGMTVGFGFPLYDSQSFGQRTSYVNVNFEYKRIAPRVSTLIKEQYYGVSVSVNLNELWFYKRKIQ